LLISVLLAACAATAVPASRGPAPTSNAAASARLEALRATGTPDWDQPTTGALGPDGFYYVADSQLNSSAAPRETVILKVPLQ
jgi:hypothetical protein